MEEWGSSVMNMVAVSLVVVAFIFYMNRLLGILPYLLDGVLRSSPLANLEASVRLTRDRNALSIIAFFTICLLASRYDAYTADFLVLFTPGVKTLVIIGISLAAFWMRLALVYLCAPRRSSRENYLLAARTFYDFLIVAAMLLGITAGVLSIFKANDLTVRTVLFYEGGFVLLVFLLRRTQILGNSCGQFMALLYMILLELIPFGALLASALIF